MSSSEATLGLPNSCDLSYITFSIQIPHSDLALIQEFTCSQGFEHLCP